MMMPAKMIICLVLSILGCFTVVWSASLQADKLSNAFVDFTTNARSLHPLPEKRAYTYVSEYKRLPVYNFGIGKRSRPYEFGVGRRSKAFNFGIGKRFNFDDQPLDYSSDVAYDSHSEDFMDSQSQFKRGSPQRFSFGVGKRATELFPLEPNYSNNNIKKPKNDTYDVNMYELYGLLQRLNKLDAIP